VLVRADGQQVGQTASRGRALRGAGGLGDGAVPRGELIVMVPAPVALVCAFYQGGCTTGGPLQNRAVSGGLPSLWPAALPWGPHHPSEGSQQLDPADLAVGVAESSSPLGGIATRFARDTALGIAGPHHPSEGSQHLVTHFSPLTYVPTCPHHPSEGSQLIRVSVSGALGSRVLITPRRDRNLGAIVAR